ncbi:hypothetical protein HMPREF9554_02711 [Treponema phagedenis F0421]|nr:hypothetical protein HMPREF9554_02711 [Treponema phagedenis F0421]
MHNTNISALLPSRLQHSYGKLPTLAPCRALFYKIFLGFVFNELKTN